MTPHLDYTINRDRRYVHVTYAAQPAFPEWLATMQEILKDPTYEPSFGFLLDRSRVPRPASTDYIKRMVEFVERHEPQRWALVVVDVGSYGMARMAEQLCLSDKIRAFMDMEEACVWLSAPGSN